MMEDVKKLQFPAMIGRPIEKTRLQVIELLLIHRHYDTSLIDRVIDDAKKVITFLEEDNLHQFRVDSHEHKE